MRAWRIDMSFARNLLPCGRSTTSRCAPLLIAVLVLSLTAACAEIRVRAGARPNVRLLEQQLVMRSSTMDDVRALLGKPFGTGTSMLPMQAGPRTMWSYYYEEGTMKDDRRIMLFVYFTPDNLYEGYMWFTSFPTVGPAAEASRGNDSATRP